MRALQEQVSRGCQVIELYKPMAKSQKPDPMPAGHDPQKHGNSAQWAAVLVAVFLGLCSLVVSVYFHYAESFAKASDEHVTSLIDAKLNPAVYEINAKLSKITSDIASLTTEVGNLKKAVKTLADDQSKETQKIIERFLSAARETKDPQTVSRILSTAASLVAVLQTEKRPAGSEFFASVVQQVDAIQLVDRGELFRQKFKVRLALANYRSRLNTEPPIPKAKAEFQSPSDISLGFSYQIFGTVYLPKNFHLSAAVPLGVALDGEHQPRTQDILTPPSDSLEDNNVSVNGMILIGASQTLDGIDWENVAFINMRIIYRRGSMKLSNVQFINCTFDLPNNQAGARIADYAALGKTVEVRIG